MEEPHWWCDTEDADLAKSYVMRLKRLLEGLLTKKTDAELGMDPDNRPVGVLMYVDMPCGSRV